MEERFLRIDKVNDGIEAACGEMDRLGLTLLERWWVFSHLELAARTVLGENADETARKFEEIRRKLQSPEVLVEVVGGDGLADDGHEGKDGDDGEDDAEDD